MKILANFLRDVIWLCVDGLILLALVVFALSLIPAALLASMIPEKTP